MKNPYELTTTLNSVCVGGCVCGGHGPDENIITKYTPYNVV